MSTAARCRAIVMGATLLAATFMAAPLAAQGESGEAEQLVVMIRCTLDGKESSGAGIIFGAANDRLYVVTASHVVRHGADEATDIRVELRSLPGEPVRATLTTAFDAKLDLAVLSIGGVKASGTGREGGEYSLEVFAEIKNVCISMGSHHIPRWGV